MAGSIQIFGTSIMKATLLDTKTKHYRFTAPQWMKRFEAQFPVQVSNYAKFGSTIEKGRRILQTRMPQLPSHSHALLEFGGNDCDFNWQTIAEAPDREHTPHTPLSRFTALYRQMIQSLRAHHISPILLTLPPIDADRYFAWFTQKDGLGSKPHPALAGRCADDLSLSGALFRNRHQAGLSNKLPACGCSLCFFG